jgi:hypothetical protein
MFLFWFLRYFSPMNADWLKAQLALNPALSKADLARALALDAPAISKILSGNRQIKAEEYVAMRRFFGLPNDGGKAAQAGGASGYVIAPLPADGLREKSGAGGEWVMPADLISRHTKAPPEKIKIFTVGEKAMQPDFAEGEQVLVDLSDTDPRSPGFFVVHDGFSHIIRHCAYVPHSKPARVRMTAQSAKIAPFETEAKNAALTGRVIAKLQWL